jgi:hypothetical protein
MILHFKLEDRKANRVAVIQGFPGRARKIATIRLDKGAVRFTGPVTAVQLDAVSLYLARK